MQQFKQISKFLSFLLRHKPEALELDMDRAGWVSAEELIYKINNDERSDFSGKEPEFTLDNLKEVVRTDDKQRYALEDRAGRLYIRANQGHSISNLDMGYEPIKAPEILYHGTGEKFVESILKGGLIAKSRQYVHLSTDIETATAVGKRHGKPVIFAVDTAKMNEEGVVFYRSENGVWLTEKVDSKYLTVISEQL